MASSTSILASGRGLESLSEWLRALVFAPELLLLDARFEPSPSSGISGSRCFEVRFLLPCNRSLSLRRVLPPINSDWLLTWWSARKGDRESWVMSGWGGAAVGADQAIQSITKLALICS